MSLGKRAVEIVKHNTGSYKLQLLKRRLFEHAEQASSDADGFTIKPIPKLTAGLQFFCFRLVASSPGFADLGWSPFFGQAKKGEGEMLVKQRWEAEIWVRPKVERKNFWSSKKLRESFWPVKKVRHEHFGAPQ